MENFYDWSLLSWGPINSERQTTDCFLGHVKTKLKKNKTAALFYIHANWPMPTKTAIDPFWFSFSKRPKAQWMWRTSRKVFLRYAWNTPKMWKRGRAWTSHLISGERAIHYHPFSFLFPPSFPKESLNFHQSRIYTSTNYIPLLPREAPSLAGVSQYKLLLLNTPKSKKIKSPKPNQQLFFFLIG